MRLFQDGKVPQHSDLHKSMSRQPCRLQQGRKPALEARAEPSRTQVPRQGPCVKRGGFSKIDNGPACKSLQSKAKACAESLGSRAHAVHPVIY